MDLKASDGDRFLPMHQRANVTDNETRYGNQSQA